MCVCVCVCVCMCVCMISMPCFIYVYVFFLLSVCHHSDVWCSRQKSGQLFYRFNLIKKSDYSWTGPSTDEKLILLSTHFNTFSYSIYCHLRKTVLKEYVHCVTYWITIVFDFCHTHRKSHSSPISTRRYRWDYYICKVSYSVKWIFKKKKQIPREKWSQHKLENIKEGN